MLRILLSLAAAFTIGLGGFAVEAGAAPGLEKYTFDKPHTQVLFGIDHLGFTKVHGRFLDYSGYFLLDRAAPEKSFVDATVKVDSLDMGGKKWDAHLKSPDFFDVKNFPVMTFKSTKIVKTGAETADVTGDMTIHGVTKPVVLHVTHNKSGPFPMNDKMYVAGFTATATVKRSDFGMKTYLPMIGDDVTITLEVQGDRVGDRVGDRADGAAPGKEKP